MAEGNHSQSILEHVLAGIEAGEFDDQLQDIVRAMHNRANKFPANGSPERLMADLDALDAMLASILVDLRSGDMLRKGTKRAVEMYGKMERAKKAIDALPASPEKTELETRVVAIARVLIDEIFKP